jgi:hypothetical protein
VTKQGSETLPIGEEERKRLATGYAESNRDGGFPCTH